MVVGPSVTGCEEVVVTVVAAVVVVLVTRGGSGDVEVTLSAEIMGAGFSVLVASVVKQSASVVIVTAPGVVVGVFLGRNLCSLFFVAKTCCQTLAATRVMGSYGFK